MSCAEYRRRAAAAATITHCCDVAAAACGSCVWRNVALLWLPCRHLFWAVALSVWRKVQWTPLLLFSPRARVLSFTNSLWATNLKSLLYWIKHFTDCMIFSWLFHKQIRNIRLAEKKFLWSLLQLTSSFENHVWYVELSFQFSEGCGTI